MALEIAGFVVGAVSLLAAFKGALDTCLLIDSFFDDGKTGCGYLALRYHIQKTRLDLWRQLYNVNEPENCPLRHKPEVVQKIVLNILSEITRLFEDTQKLAKRHDIKTASTATPQATGGEAKTHGDRVDILAKVVVKPKSRVMWTIKGKDEFKEKVSRIRELVDDLHEFTTDATQSHSLTRALPSISLKAIGNVELLRTLQEPSTKVDAALANSAKIKLLRKSLDKSSETSVTLLTSEQVKFLKNSTDFATLRSPSVGFSSVWIEWTVINQGTASDEYVRRIKSLGHLLEEAGDATLRIPVCYGIFDDLAYEAQNGSRRLGYVFGAPRAERPLPSPAPVPRYEGNFRDYPPSSLSDLIRAYPRMPIPLLGDRFTLAFTLATAFSHFHSAGWLHKGFHSGNIIFLRQDLGQESKVVITDPFITGFQYSRPTTTDSLSRGPLEKGELEHYYHPSADKGFTRRIDLYSLGVVLCEIGRWELVGEKVSERTRKKMVDRRAWRDYMVDKVLADIGWRMGDKYQGVVRILLECRLPDDDHGLGDDDNDDDDDDGGLFEQQYFEKVIQPLGACSA
ncbi:prion-inhibition and propagation-domain-containing protein [Xylariomycetidae sp. FL2044]|nr:prion-inhibition and propagation-domain-containing protein [Xylariomycetidae sp. FL2044]